MRSWAGFAEGGHPLLGEPLNTHALPVADSRAHELSPRCWCRPTVVPGSVVAYSPCYPTLTKAVYQHHAEDGRLEPTRP